MFQGILTGNGHANYLAPFSDQQSHQFPWRILRGALIESTGMDKGREADKQLFRVKKIFIKQDTPFARRRQILQILGWWHPGLRPPPPGRDRGAKRGSGDRSLPPPASWHSSPGQRARLSCHLQRMRGGKGAKFQPWSGRRPVVFGVGDGAGGQRGVPRSCRSRAALRAGGWRVQPRAAAPRACGSPG